MGQCPNRCYQTRAGLSQGPHAPRLPPPAPLPPPGSGGPGPGRQRGVRSPDAGGSPSPGQRGRAGELTAATTLIAQLDWEGRVLTGDALSCQRRLCAQVVEAGGDYLFLVDANQPSLQADIEQLFAPPPPPAAGHAPITLEEQQARTVSKGHGRLEVREIRVSSELADYADWPYLAQVFQLTRTWTRKGGTRQEVKLGITSLPQMSASAEQRLTLKRGHWGIENRLHYVLDETLGEDRSPLHCGHGPDIMAILRRSAVSALRRAGYDQIAAPLRPNCRHPQNALKVLRLLL